MFSTSADRRRQLDDAAPRSSSADDRGYYSAPAISPNGTRRLARLQRVHRGLQDQRDGAAQRPAARRPGPARDARARRRGGLRRVAPRRLRATRAARRRTTWRPSSSATTSTPRRRGRYGIERVERRPRRRRLPGDRRASARTCTTRRWPPASRPPRPRSRAAEERERGRGRGARRSRRPCNRCARRPSGTRTSSAGKPGGAVTLPTVRQNPGGARSHARPSRQAAEPGRSERRGRQPYASPAPAGGADTGRLPGRAGRALGPCWHDDDPPLRRDRGLHRRHRRRAAPRARRRLRHREPGVGLGQHALAAVVVARPRRSARSTLFPRVRPAARAALAFFFGALAPSTARCTSSTSRATAWPRATSPASSPLAAGVVLVGLAAYIPWRTAARARPAAAALGLPDRRGPGRAAARAVHGRADRHRDHRDAQVPRARRRAAQRRLPRGRLRRQRRRPPLGLVPPDAQRRDAPRPPRRRRRPHRRGRPRQAPRPPRLRRPAATTPAAAGAARASRTRSAGAGPRTSPAPRAS